MNRGGMVALLTIGPLAAGVCVLLLVAAVLLRVFTQDEQKLAGAAVDVAITIAFGAALVVAIAHIASD